MLEPSQDAAANGMGEGGKSSVGVPHSLTLRLINMDSKYKNTRPLADEFMTSLR
jgi:hypothetical protein